MILLRLFVIVFLFVCLNGAPPAFGADWLSKFHPYISVKGEYSDNLDLTPTNKREDYYMTVQPGIRFNNMDKMSGIDLNYSLAAVFYDKYTDLNYIGHNGQLNAKYMTSAGLNFYLKESFIRSDEPREQEYYTTTADYRVLETRDATFYITDYRYVLATRTERNTYWRNVVTPTIEYQFGPENRVGVNYRNNIYESEDPGVNDSKEDYINPFFSYWFDKQNGITLEYGYTLGDFDQTPDLEGHRAYGRFTHRFTPKSAAFAEYTFLRRTFEDAPYNDYDVHEPNVGMTFTITPTLNASVQVGYFWQEPEVGSKEDGISYRADLSNTDPRTTFRLSVQGGYTEDYFTSENLGFNKYHRVTGYVNHRLEQRLSIGCFGSFEWAEYENPVHEDTTWIAGARASYMLFKWLTLAAEYSHRDRDSDVDTYDYTENRAMVTLTATY